MDKKYQFKLANGNLYDAVMDFEDGINPIKNRIFNTIGDRIRLMECLENNGFYIVPKDVLKQLKTTLNNIGNTYPEVQDMISVEIEKIDKFLS